MDLHWFYYRIQLRSPKRKIVIFMWHVEYHKHMRNCRFCRGPAQFCSQSLTVTKVFLSILCMRLLIFPSIQHILFKSNFCLKILNRLCFLMEIYTRKFYYRTTFGPWTVFRNQALCHLIPRVAGYEIVYKLENRLDEVWYRFSWRIKELKREKISF